MKRASASERAARSPAGRAAGPAPSRAAARRRSSSAPQAPGDRLDRRERVVDLVAEHAHEPLPGLALLVAQRPAQVGEHEQLVRRPSCRKVLRRTSQRPPPPGKVSVERARRLAVETRSRARAASAVRPSRRSAGCAEQPLAGAVHEPQPALARRRRTPRRRSPP